MRDAKAIAAIRVLRAKRTMIVICTVNDREGENKGKHSNDTRSAVRARRWIFMLHRRRPFIVFVLRRSGWLHDGALLVLKRILLTSLHARAVCWSFPAPSTRATCWWNEVCTATRLNIVMPLNLDWASVPQREGRRAAPSRICSSPSIGKRSYPTPFTRLRLTAR